ncbi:FadR/GntR family transcriptional regulator [Parahaliea maris]|uniref:FadR/GntR family transcriptional regulator n=1 Tax=Parahaliea maris TaxID=2716870 RepID=UPI001BB41662|nr:FadR/GntR family transcriptional regulator [Parahaliea maris]
MTTASSDRHPFAVESVGRKGSLSSQVAAQLEAMIRQGRIEVGHKLPTEAALCDMFAVSRTVVREAIANLKSLGLVETRRGVGTTVIAGEPRETFFTGGISATTVNDILDILELRLSVEVTAAGLAAVRRQETDLAQMASCLERFESAVARGGLARAEDLEFHCAIASATGNPLFVKFYELMNKSTIPRAQLVEEGIDWEPTARYLTEVNQEHRSIYQAVLNQDAESAERAMYDHLYRAFHMYEQYKTG